MKNQIPTAIATEGNVIPSLGWSHIANSASLSVVVGLSTKGDHDNYGDYDDCNDYNDYNDYGDYEL